MSNKATGSDKETPKAPATAADINPTTTTTAVNTNNEFDENIQSILDLMYNRVNGTATNEQIEMAVQNILQQQPTHLPLPSRTVLTTTDSTTSSVSSSNRNPLHQQHQQVIRDLENYDDEEEDDEVQKDSSRKKDRNSFNPSSKASTTKRQSTVTNARMKKSSTNVEKDEEEVIEETDGEGDLDNTDLSIYECIPLGKQGAQMMTIFGDGPRPHVDAVRATLHGTRHKLQCTIQDARHVRRQQTILYRTAKNSIKSEKPTKPGIYKQEWSTELLFRATSGYDPLAYIPKCGFGIEDLYKLYPEELNAYNKWNEMHTEVAEATTTPSGEDNEENLNDDQQQQKTKADDSDNINTTTNGHLQQRAAQFDVRTDKMGQNWYMKYSKIRQKGSFLPRYSIGSNHPKNNRTTNVDTKWETMTRQKRKVGEHTGGGWTHMSASAVRFLHWIGFDPQSPVLPPPNDDVTAALAFLAYDFFGRIVETAIFLRNRQKQLQYGQEINEVAISNYELKRGEQLTEQDIECAMNDPDIKPVPLYTSVERTKQSLRPQLYFGPGFEDRLEMEMEEMLWDSSTKKKENVTLTEEELLVRQKEDELFAQLAQPPTEDGLVTLLRGTEESIDDVSHNKNNNTSTGAKQTAVIKNVPSKRAKR